MSKSLSETCLFITDSKPITACWFVCDPGLILPRKDPRQHMEDLSYYLHSGVGSGVAPGARVLPC